MITDTNVSSLLNAVIAGIQEKKGKDIISLDFAPIDNPVCKYFVICNGDSNTHVNAIADSVDEFAKKKVNANAWHIEGKENAQWVVLDYVDVVVHVFQQYYREYYSLEELWADCTQCHYK